MDFITIRVIGLMYHVYNDDEAINTASKLINNKTILISVPDNYGNNHYLSYQKRNNFIISKSPYIPFYEMSITNTFNRTVDGIHYQCHFNSHSLGIYYYYY